MTQLWDFGSGSLIERVAWNQSAMVSEPCFVCVTRVRRLASVMACRGALHRARARVASAWRQLLGAVQHRRAAHRGGRERRE